MLATSLNFVEKTIKVDKDVYQGHVVNVSDSHLLVLGSFEDPNVYSVSLKTNDFVCTKISKFVDNIIPQFSSFCNYKNDNNQKCVLIYTDDISSNYHLVSYNCDTNKWTNISKLHKNNLKNINISSRM